MACLANYHLFQTRIHVHPSERCRLNRSGSIGGLLGGLSSTNSAWRIIVITNVEAQPGRVDVAVTPEEEAAKDGLGHDIQNPVEDSFRVRSDDVATLTETPGDGVEEPQEDGPHAADEIRPRDVIAQRVGVFACSPGHGPGNPEESHATEDEVAPLEPDISKNDHD